MKFHTGLILCSLLCAACQPKPSCDYPPEPLPPMGYGLTQIGNFAADDPNAAGNFQMIDRNVGYRLDQPGTLRKTTDGGRNWTGLSVPYTKLGDFRFADEQTGWILRREQDSVATLIKTEDGGTTFTEYRYPNLDRRFSELILAEDGDLYASSSGLGAANSDIARSTDGGLTFERIYTSSVFSVSDLAVRGQRLYFIAGGHLQIAERSGEVVATRELANYDGSGQLWVMDENSMLFTGKKQLLRSNDGGVSWSLLHDGEARILGGNAATDGVLLHLQVADCHWEMGQPISAFALLRDELEIGPRSFDVYVSTFNKSQYVGNGRWFMVDFDSKFHELVKQ